LHNGAASQSGTKTAILALVLLFPLEPVMLFVKAFFANYTNFISPCFEVLPASRLIWKVSKKIAYTILPSNNSHRLKFLGTLADNR
jgi:hypothetical protein